MKSIAKAVLTVSFLSVALLTAGCSNTWQGVKSDTSKNMDKAGDTVIKAGEKMKSE
jgi:predicted small secreted protein|tara:strand:+ start:550 stop:717 length:168 start_codon:yes stop_codon:yes gene_type:complete